MAMLKVELQADINNTDEYILKCIFNVMSVPEFELSPLQPLLKKSFNGKREKQDK